MKKSEMLSNAIGMLPEDMVEETNKKRTSRQIRGFSIKRHAWKIISVAACFAVIAGIILLIPKGIGAEALAEAIYPKTAKYTAVEIFPAYQKWRQDNAARRDLAGQLDGGIQDFYRKSTEQFLISDKNENLVYSPVNVYMALAMLAETTNSDSREQILELLGSDSIETLRGQANALWKANYRNDGATTSILANSLWLDDEYSYNKSVTETIAQNYYASSYSGDLSSDNMTKALREWINKQTGGLLKNAAGGIEHDPLAVMDICSTVYFRAKWANEFSSSKNDTKTFHSPNGDIKIEFMNNKTNEGMYYAGEDFGAICLDFENRGEMWFILPDEDKTINDVISSGEYLEMIGSPATWEKKKVVKINYSVPKFDISSDIDLVEGLKALGISDIFDIERADFSPLTEDTDEIYINSAQHAARVTIDEKGCTAAAFTVIMGAGAAMPPEDKIDFVLDRPFLFAVMSDTQQPLFIGTVNNP